MRSNSLDIPARSLKAVRKRFFSRVRKTSACWEWTGSILGGERGGYGQFALRESEIGHTSTVKAHRVSWVLSRGRIPAGVDILHKCDNRRCVRPSHLFKGNAKINAEDRTAKGRGVRGSRVNTAKLSESDVRRVRRILAKDSRHGIRVAIARKMKISPQIIYRIAEGVCWRSSG